MGISKQLFTTENICLGAIDHQQDAEVESLWTHDLGYLRMFAGGPAAPMSAAQIKKNYEAIEKIQEEKDSRFYFTIRFRQDDRLIGFAEIAWIEWSNGTGSVRLGIGNPQDRRKGYGSEALSLLLRFAFDELNLFRLSAIIPEYNTPGLGLFSKFGFVEEVRRRQAIHRDARRWDSLELGLCAEDWGNNN